MSGEPLKLDKRIVICYDMLGPYFACSCGNKHLELRLEDHKVHLVANDGGVIEIHCTDCHGRYDLSSLLGHSARWINSGSSKPTAGPAA